MEMWNYQLDANNSWSWIFVTDCQLMHDWLYRSKLAVFFFIINIVYTIFKQFVDQSEEKKE